MLDIVFIGHFAVDTIIQNGKEAEPTLGGSVAYCSFAVKEYDSLADIGIISVVGRENFDRNHLENMQSKGIDITGTHYSNSKNTKFILDYYDHARKLRLEFRSPDINIEHIPTEYYHINPKAVAFVPICNEINEEFITYILSIYPSAYIGIDLQGFIRTFDELGHTDMIIDSDSERSIANIIHSIGKRLILKGSEIEMMSLSKKVDISGIMNYFNATNKGITIMTMGEKGSVISKRGKDLLYIPAFRPEKLEDETGAGDVYLSIFLYEYTKSDESWNSVKNAGYLASVASSFLIEKKGINGCVSKDTVLERMRDNNTIECSLRV